MTPAAIDIVMDGWDSFIQTCENEEYASCAVVVDGEAYQNVGIRAKGNTPLCSYVWITVNGEDWGLYLAVEGIEDSFLRLIQALKALGEGDAESALDMDQVLRSFVVHNFVVNGDSYTGSMVHNYYLYEEDGKLSMLPWDYNLAFGTFQGGDAAAAVNDPIDTPLSAAGGGADGAPAREHAGKDGKEPAGP